MAIRKLFLLPAIFALVTALAVPAADWINFRGDADLTGCQRHETILTISNVKDMKPIWKLKLDSNLTAPVILGHWITNHGTKELVLVASLSGNVYAVDADLGRLFWTRHLDGVSAGPALAPGPPGDIDDDDDVRQAVRPVYVVSRGGVLYQLHPTTGTDYAAPRTFADIVPDAAGLVTDGKLVYASAATPAATWEDGWEFVAAPSAVRAVRNGQTAWTSRGMISPAPPVVANQIVFALARGSAKTRAVLYGLDARTGKELFSSGKLIESYVSNTGLAVANGHVCLGTVDGTLYCFGFPVDL